MVLKGIEVVEQQHLARGPAAQSVAPDAERRRATRNDAVSLHARELEGPRQALDKDLGAAHRQQHQSGSPHGVRGDLGAVERRSEHAALAAIVRPQETRRQPEQFSRQVGLGVAQRGPQQHKHARERQAGRAVASRAVPTPGGPLLP